MILSFILKNPFSPTTGIGSISEIITIINANYNISQRIYIFKPLRVTLHVLEKYVYSDFFGIVIDKFNIVEFKVCY